MEEIVTYSKDMLLKMKVSYELSIKLKGTFINEENLFIEQLKGNEVTSLINDFVISTNSRGYNPKRFITKKVLKDSSVNLIASNLFNIIKNNIKNYKEGMILIFDDSYDELDFIKIKDVLKRMEELLKNYEDKETIIKNLKFIIVSYYPNKSLNKEQKELFNIEDFYKVSSGELVRFDYPKELLYERIKDQYLKRYKYLDYLNNSKLIINLLDYLFNQNEFKLLSFNNYLNVNNHLSALEIENLFLSLDKDFKTKEEVKSYLLNNAEALVNDTSLIKLISNW